MKKEMYDISGMTCSACSARVEKTAKNLSGVTMASVNLLTNLMKIEYDDTQLSSAEIISAIEKAGYGASLRSDPISASAAANTLDGGSEATAASGDIAGKTPNAAQKHIRAMKKRLILSFVFLIPMMYVSMHGMLHHMFGLPVPGFVKRIFDGPQNAVTNVLTQFLFLLVILSLNRHYFINGFRNLLHGAPNMDTLIALGSAASTTYGIFALYRIGYGLGYGNEALVNHYLSDIYFESAAMIVTLITLGKYLEARSKGKTSRAIEKLMDLSPRTAIVLRDEAEMEIPVSLVALGDTVIVKPGARVPVDGMIVSGHSSLDESAITGESIPSFKKEGDRVISASLNQNGYFRMKAERVGEDTTIRQIIRLVDEASSSKAPIARLADKVSGIFVPTVILLAIITTVIWILSGASFEFALSLGISVLVISCPCALGLATPVAIMVGTGKGAENGILIKSGEALETAHHVDTVVLDKTGTITQGKPHVTDVIPYGCSERELLRIAVLLEIKSEHPLAEAVLSYAASSTYGIYKPDVILSEDFTILPGQGISAVINNVCYYSGNVHLPVSCMTPDIRRQAELLSDEGKTPLLFASDTCFLGIIAVSDVVKPTSAQAIRLLHDMRIRTVMLTGDNERVAKAIQVQTGISEVVAGVLPQDKEKHIRSLKEEGHIVAMIGDGINDAPALASADIGIAIGAGTEIAIESADAVLIRNDLLDAVTAIRLSKAVIRNIRENLFWAFFYNCIGIPLAAGVLYVPFHLKLTPMFGAAAMSLSSVCVVTNALRLRFFKPTVSAGSPLESASNPEQPALTPKSVSEPDLPALTPESVSEPDLPAPTPGQTADSTAQTVIIASNGAQNKEEKNMNVTLSIEGMMCEHCKKHVEEALSKLPVSAVTVNLAEKNAVITPTADISDETLKQTIADAGYELTAITR